MITNTDITYYHKILDNNKLPVWEKHIFKGVWLFGTKTSIQNNGNTETKIVNVRIPMDKVEDVTIFSIGDIVANGIQPDIETQSELKNVEFYNITSININKFGSNPHIHLGGN